MAPPFRHAELVSASIARQGAAQAEEWILKQVQGDEQNGDGL